MKQTKPAMDRMPRSSLLISMFSEPKPEGSALDRSVEAQMTAQAKGHAALPPDAGFSIGRAEVASVQRFKSTVMEGASDRIVRAATSASCPLHASTEGASLFPGAGSLGHGWLRGRRSALKETDLVVERQQCGLVAKLASRERAVVEQRVEADEAGASHGASPLNPVFYGFQNQRPSSTERMETDLARAGAEEGVEPRVMPRLRSRGAEVRSIDARVDRATRASIAALQRRRRGGDLLRSRRVMPLARL